MPYYLLVSRKSLFKNLQRSIGNDQVVDLAEACGRPGRSPCVSLALGGKRGLKRLLGLMGDYR
jgi:hypothetical protein